MFCSEEGDIWNGNSPSPCAFRGDLPKFRMPAALAVAVVGREKLPERYILKCSLHQERSQCLGLMTPGTKLLMTVPSAVCKIHDG